MAKKSRSYLTETSAVFPAIGIATDGNARHYAETVADGEQFTSTYIRKEFILAVVCELAYIAVFISQRSSIKDAFYLLSQRYSIRAIKVDVIALGHLVEKRRPMETPSQAAEEIGLLAIHWLKTFDRKFKEQIENTCGCQIGNKKLHVDYNNLIKHLNEFQVEFGDSVTDCEVNDFLGVGKVDGRGRSITDEESLRGLDSVKNLAILLDKGRRFVCNDCRKIGDAVIALEQPQSHCLVHLDKAFNKLCGVLERDHKQLKSAYAIDKEEMTS